MTSFAKPLAHSRTLPFDSHISRTQHTMFLCVLNNRNLSDFNKLDKLISSGCMKSLGCFRNSEWFSHAFWQPVLIPNILVNYHEVGRDGDQNIFVINFDIFLTVQLSITLVNDQLDAQFFYFIIRLLQSSTCFEQRRAHHQEIKCINTATGIVTLCKWPSGVQVCTGRSLADSDDTRCCINKIHPPDDEHDFFRNV